MFLRFSSTSTQCVTKKEYFGLTFSWNVRLDLSCFTHIAITSAYVNDPLARSLSTIVHVSTNLIAGSIANPNNYLFSLGGVGRMMGKGMLVCLRKNIRFVIMTHV